MRFKPVIISHHMLSGLKQGDLPTYLPTYSWPRHKERR
jgi:hypothetical protein